MVYLDLYKLLEVLGGFSFNQNQNIKNSSTISIEEAYKILNLDIKKKITKDDVQKAHIKIQKKIHPDISPETTRLSMIVNEAKEVVLKNIALEFIINNFLINFLNRYISSRI